MIQNYTVSNYEMPKPSRDGEYFMDGKLVAVNVDLASQLFHTSTRRIRQMLLDGKLKGAKYGKAWRIDYPFQIVMGKRGPMLGYNRYNKRLKTRNNKDFINPAFTKGL
jgi:hypothetical protein